MFEATLQIFEINKTAFADYTPPLPLHPDRSDSQAEWDGPDPMSRKKLVGSLSSHTVAVVLPWSYY